MESTSSYRRRSGPLDPVADNAILHGVVICCTSVRDEVRVSAQAALFFPAKSGLLLITTQLDWIGQVC